MSTLLERPAAATRTSRFLFFLAVAGPGLAVMLADTDAGSLITAAQSGAQWGYSLLGIQLVLIPIVFVAQELTVRLGIVTGRGHGELIRERFGPVWAWVSVGALVVACAGAIVSEMSGLVGVGLMWGIPAGASTTAVVLFLAGVVLTGSYRRVERIALAIGVFELVFLLTAVLSHPDPGQMAGGLTDLPLGDSNFLFLVSANIGAVVMPWMIFYQQSAVVAKGLTVRHLKAARADTMIGAVVTQAVMIGILVTVAAALWATHQDGVTLNSIGDISAAITPRLGEFVGKVLLSLGFIGASLIAALVASLTAAWGLGEVSGYERTLESSPQRAPWFYAVFIAVVAVTVNSGVNLISINLGVQIVNALLLPLALGFLLALARTALPPRYRLRGWYGIAVTIVLTLTAALGVYAGIAGLLG